MDQAFQVALPLLGQIQLDVGTVISGIVLLMFLIVGFDLVTAMLLPRFESRRYGRSADYFEEQARNVREARDSWSRDSFEWEQQNLVYKKLLNKGADLRVKGWR